jgi:hypothetical protein
MICHQIEVRPASRAEQTPQVQSLNLHLIQTQLIRSSPF